MPKFTDIIKQIVKDAAKAKLRGDQTSRYPDTQLSTLQPPTAPSVVMGSVAQILGTPSAPKRVLSGISEIFKSPETKEAERKRALIEYYKSAAEKVSLPVTPGSDAVGKLGAATDRFKEQVMHPMVQTIGKGIEKIPIIGKPIIAGTETLKQGFNQMVEGLGDFLAGETISKRTGGLAKSVIGGGLAIPSAIFTTGLETVQQIPITGYALKFTLEAYSKGKERLFEEAMKSSEGLPPSIRGWWQDLLLPTASVATDLLLFKKAADILGKGKGALSKKQKIEVEKYLQTNEGKIFLNKIRQSFKEQRMVGLKGLEDSSVRRGIEKSTPPPLSPVDQLIDIIDKAARPSREKLEELYSKERSRRAGKLAGIFKEAKGEKTFFQGLKALKGKLAPEKAQFESIRGKIDQPAIDSLFKQILENNDLNVFEKITASKGLQNIFEGKIPVTSELSLLENVFGGKLISKILEKRPVLSKVKDLVTEFINIPRSFMTSFDMSAPLRQGIVLGISHPILASKAFKEMFRQAFSEKNFQDWLINLKKTPEYRLIKDSNLYISDPTKISGGLSAKEEKYMTNYAEKIPLFGIPVKISGRGYIAYLNKLRVDTFNHISKKFIKEGINPKTNISAFESLAEFINNATGRGNLGKLGRLSQELNTVFFSPRLIASRFNMLNPVWYMKQHPAVRKEAIKSFVEFVGVGITVLGLAKLSGADVETDPRSSDFGKIRVGNTRWDIWGGFQQWARLFTQLATGQRKSTSTGEVVELTKKQFPFETRLDVGLRFLRGKLAPVPSLALELADGQKQYGGDLLLKKETIDLMMPLYLGDIKEIFGQFGAEALYKVYLPAFFGVGVQTYEEKPKTSNGGIFGKKSSEGIFN